MQQPAHDSPPPRFEVDAMYSSLVASRLGTRRRGPTQAGHLYEVGLDGARIELDRALACGDRIALEFELPGCGAPFLVHALVTEVFDEVDDPGARRHCVAFEHFIADSKERLASHLAQGWLRRASAPESREAKSLPDVAHIEIEVLTTRPAVAPRPLQMPASRRTRAASA